MSFNKIKQTMPRGWKKIRSKLVYSNLWIKIHEDTVFRPDLKQMILAGQIECGVSLAALNLFFLSYKN
jgi:hypothetical protein